MYLCTIRFDKLRSGDIGIVPKSANVVVNSWGKGYGRSSNGCFFAGWNSSDSSDEYGFATGDSMTVIVDLDANTISFRKNGAIIGKTHPIEHQEYYFAVLIYEGFDAGGCMTIVEIG